MYSEGLSISTPLSGKYQIAALDALRFGIEAYDKRKGWRGPLTNTQSENGWEDKIKNLKLMRH